MLSSTILSKNRVHSATELLKQCIPFLSSEFVVFLLNDISSTPSRKLNPIRSRKYRRDIDVVVISRAQPYMTEVMRMEHISSNLILDITYMDLAYFYYLIEIGSPFALKALTYGSRVLGDLEVPKNKNVNLLNTQKLGRHFTIYINELKNNKDHTEVGLRIYMSILFIKKIRKSQRKKLPLKQCIEFFDIYRLLRDQSLSTNNRKVLHFFKRNSRNRNPSFIVPKIKAQVLKRGINYGY